MKNGRMFAPLMKFKNKECFDKNQIIEFITPNEKAIYHIVCVAKVKADDSWYSFIEDSGESHYNEKLRNCIQNRCITQIMNLVTMMSS